MAIPMMSNMMQCDQSTEPAAHVVRRDRLEVKRDVLRAAGSDRADVLVTR